MNASNSRLPRLAITMGDPAGIGPEIVIRTLVAFGRQNRFEPIIFGDREWMQQTSVRFGFADVSFISDEQPDLKSTGYVFPLRQSTTADLSATQLGVLGAEAGKAAAQCVITSAQAALVGEVDAICTAPLNKEAMALGGYKYAGHTELLASLTGSTKYGMLLLSGDMRVIHVSTHVSLREAITRVKTERILDCIRLGNIACLELGIANPKIAVAGLNPHAGEHGLFGEEEVLEISPAIAAAISEGIDVTGPHPPDTIFSKSSSSRHDLVVAMYHDQGHIPIKLNGMESGVNVSVGMPIIRTSVDHGTAFDIAESGIANESSMIAAIEIALQMVNARRQRHSNFS